MLDIPNGSLQEISASSRPPLEWRGKGWAPQLVQRFLGSHRPWEEIEGFYRRLIAGRASLLDLDFLENHESHQEANGGGLRFSEPSGGVHLEDRERKYSAENNTSISPERKIQHTRNTYAVTLSYFGPAFSGWAWAPELSGTAQGAVQGAISEVVDAQKSTQVVVNAAGRTDKGVSAYGQVVSFYSWDELAQDDIAASINAASPGNLRALHVQLVPRSFHATFQAIWRRYIYLLPLRSSPTEAAGGTHDPVICPHSGIDLSQADAFSVCPDAANRLLKALEAARSVDFHAFARDTPKGKSLQCTILSARAYLVIIRGGTQPEGTRALCVDVTAHRFVRKMMRVLVATCVRESIPEAAACGEHGDQALLKLAETRDRLKTAPPAPALGLCLLAVGYDAASVRLPDGLKQY